MAQADPQQRRPVAPLSAAEVDALTRIGPEDVAAARAAWKAAVPKRLGKLLDAGKR